ncbi:MAG TPA: DUF2231 domain-containing protein [Gemmatimonadaceae bacterium]
MLPYPLHPAIVHFPVVLAFLLPISAAIAIWTIRKGARVNRAWMVAVAIAATLSLSSWVSVETGENQDDKVEQVIQEGALDTHEEAAEAFLTGSIVLLVIAAGGLIRGRIGSTMRIVAAAGSVALLAGGAYVGHTGGQLVYKYGAASAYATPSPANPNVAARGDHDD